MKTKAIVALLLLLAGAPLLAQDRSTQITVWTSQTEMQGENVFDGGFETDFDDGSALGLSVNRYFGKRYSVEGAVFGLRSEAGLLFEGAAPVDLGKLDMRTFTVGGQFHFLGQSRFDPYVGAGGAYVIVEELFSPDLQATGVGRLELDNKLTYYLNAGVGFQIARGLGLVIDARYFPYETSARSTVTGIEQDLEISPRVLSAGLRFRF